MGAAIALALLLTGIPTVHDGDTLRMGPTRMRLDAIDAPELAGSPKCRRGRQVRSCEVRHRAVGVLARDRLRALTIRGVECRGEGADQYERAVVRCYTPDGRDVAAVLVREGLAWPDRRYGGERYAGDELVARAARRGVWR